MSRIKGAGSTLLVPEKNFPEKIEPVTPIEKIATSLTAFFARAEIVKVQEVHTQRDGSQETVESTQRLPMPTIEAWCVENRISSTRLKDLSQEHDSIAEALQFARDTMKSYLITGGLEDKYDPRFAIFVATNETDMKVKSEHTNIIKKGKDILSQIEEEEAPLIVEANFELVKQ